MVEIREKGRKGRREGHNIPVSRSTSHCPLVVVVVTGGVCTLQSVMAEGDFYKIL